MPLSPHALLMGVPAGAPAWTPASLTNVTEWWDFSDASKITASSNQVSNVATSLPSGGHSLVQATPANQPLTATDTINGRNVIKFDGSNDSLKATVASTSNPVTVFVVAKCANTSGQHDVTCFNSDARVFITGGNIGVFAGAFLVSGTAWGTTNPHNVIAVFAGASSAIYIDGSGTPTTGNPSTNPSGAISLTVGNYLNGVTEPWSGDVAEVAIATGSVSSGDRASWNAYTLAKWGV